MNERASVVESGTRPAAGLSRLLAGRRSGRAGALIAAALVAIVAAPSRAQMPAPRFGEVVPRDVREMYDRGLAIPRDHSR